jgi:UDP-2,4-diacetamido-2,4,6-trideoxy-beta-L-altropyranose hydrolase
MQKNLVIRADAGSEIGTGHVMRSLALAQAWQDDGGEVFFVLSCDLPLLGERLKKEGMNTLRIHNRAGTPGDAGETARIARERGADWVVVDGYQFGAGYQKTIRDAGLSLLFIDDYGHADHYYADIVLNQNMYADMSLYRHYEPYTRFLLGTDYILLRKEFLDRAPRDRTVPETAWKILVTLGGSDPDNITLAIINALKTVDTGNPEVTIVIGGANPHEDLIREAVKDLPRATLITNAGNMPELMAWADGAISAGGSTCWELLFMGVPSLVIPIAKNQEPVVKKLASLKIAQAVDAHALKNPGALAKIIVQFLHSRTMRSGFSHRMARYVDGKGASRVIDAMRGPRITLRKAELSDCKQVWSWINDPLVRSVSFSPGPIPLERHQAWFSSALNDPGLVYYIALDHNARPVGQARFRSESGEGVISVLVDPGYRGRSLGSALIRDATEQFFYETGTRTVKAFIKTGNEVSRKAFTKAGYTGQGLREYKGEKAYLFIKMRETR